MRVRSGLGLVLWLRSGLKKGMEKVQVHCQSWGGSSDGTRVTGIRPRVGVVVT